MFTKSTLTTWFRGLVVLGNEQAYFLPQKWFLKTSDLDSPRMQVTFGSNVSHFRVESKLLSRRVQVTFGANASHFFAAVNNTSQNRQNTCSGNALSVGKEKPIATLMSGAPCVKKTYFSTLYIIIREILCNFAPQNCVQVGWRLPMSPVHAACIGMWQQIITTIKNRINKRWK